MNDGIKLSAQTSFIEKETVQRKKNRFMKLTGFWAAQTLGIKIAVSNPI